MTRSLPPSPVPWLEARSADFTPALAARGVAILPIGSTEQHGPHLPVGVDCLLVAEVARRAALAAAPAVPVRVLPTVWASLAEHHMAEPGGVTLDFDTLQAFVGCVVRSLARQGQRRILLLNGHGGNMAALVPIVDRLTVETGLPLAAATYWVPAAAAFASVLEEQDQLLHACEAETSMMLRLVPGLVDMAAAHAVDSPARGFEAPGGVYRWRPIGHWSASGVVGRPQRASAAKGERLLQAAADAIAERIADPATWHECPVGDAW